MSSQGYADFLKRMGHNVISIDGVFWFDTHPRIYLCFPFHHPLNPKRINISSVFKKGGIVLRFPCLSGNGRSSYRISITDKNYDLTSLNGKSRNQTRRGLENCTVRKLTNNEVLCNAFNLNTDTLQRQGRILTTNEKEYWKKYYQEILSVDGASIWGAFVQDELAAFLISVRMKHCENILIVRSRASLLKFYPNNALLYTFVSKALSSDEIDEISIGLESIQSNMESLDRFKLGMGFKKVPIGQCIIFRPPFALLLRGRGVKYILGLLKNYNEKFAKLYGLVTWYDEQNRGQ